MPAPGKLVHVVGFLCKEESTYATPVSLAGATDGVQMFFDNGDFGAILMPKYAQDGDLGVSAGELGRLKRVGPTGRFVDGFAVPTLFRGGGAAYSASVTSTLHKLLKAAGFDATVDTTAAAEKWTYSPTPFGSVGTSLTFEAYTRGEKYPLCGAIADFAFDAPNTKPPKFTTTLSGIFNGDPSDVACPSITYPNLTVMPPVAQGILAAIGSFAGNMVVRSSSFKLVRAISPRQAQSSSEGHAGFAPYGRMPLLTIVLEATALVGTPFNASGGLDPFNLHKNATVFAATWQLGSVQYNRLKFNLPQAQVVDVRNVQDGPVATVEVDIAPHMSTPIAKDDLTFVTD